MKDFFIQTFFLKSLSKLLRSFTQSLENTAAHPAQTITNRKTVFLAVGIACFVMSAAALVVTLGFLIEREAFLSERLATHQWRMASTVYAEAPVIRRGDSVSAEWLVKYLERLNYQRIATSHVKTSQYNRIENDVLFQKKNLPSDTAETFPVRVSFEGNKITNLYDGETRKQIPAYELEPVAISNLFESQYEKRTLVAFNELPQHLIHAVIAIEDRRFYKHRGVDLIGILRAVRYNLSSEAGRQGGSTITQQLIKNFYLTPEKSFSRKINEAALALLLERKLNKDKILELYLNEVYLGQQGPVSIKGVGEASRFYFHKEIRDINVSEAALLAGMLQGPQRYNPYRHFERSKDRRDRVLLAMKNEGYITQLQYTHYKKSPIVVQPLDTSIQKAPYFGDLVSKQLEEKFSADELHHGNLHVMTTLNVDMQEAAEEALTEGLAEIDRIHFKRVGKLSQGCLIAIDPRTGAIRAFVGGRNYSKSQFDRVKQASRQPGSSFKPFIYAAAIESAFRSGYPITASSFLSDDPLTLEFDRQKWSPQNYDRSYHGTVTVRNALSKSMNVATARLANEVGLSRIASMSREFGFLNVQPYPSISLGAFEVSPWQMTEAYTALANGGIQTTISSIQTVLDTNGDTLFQNVADKKRILHAQTAFIVTDMLKTVMKSGTGASIGRWKISQDVAGKTGTTNDYKDAWFIGYTPDLICLVWTGYDDNTPIKMTGAQAALPIWARFMKTISAKLPSTKFVAPNGLVTREIDPATGKLATLACPTVITEIFVKGTEPLESCDDYDHLQPYTNTAENQFQNTEDVVTDTSIEAETSDTIYAIRSRKTRSKTIFTNIAPVIPASSADSPTR